MKAVAKFPAFCGEGDDIKVTCTKELAALLAHAVDVTGESATDEDAGVLENDSEEVKRLKRAGGLNHTEGKKCAGGNEGSDCDFAAGWGWNLWTQPETAKQYYPRGAFQLTGNYNYARLSAVLYEGYGSANVLLEDPDKVATDGYVGFASALYLWLNAEDDTPSMHDVITGHYVPNEAEKAAGIKGGFGTTINILNGGPNCGGEANNDSATKRIDYYNTFLKELGMDASAL